MASRVDIGWSTLQRRQAQWALRALSRALVCPDKLRSRSSSHQGCLLLPLSCIGHHVGHHVTRRRHPGSQETVLAGPPPCPGMVHVDLAARMLGRLRAPQMVPLRKDGGGPIPRGDSPRPYDIVISFDYGRGDAARSTCWFFNSACTKPRALTSPSA